jgi:hypothetical protein
VDEYPPAGVEDPRPGIWISYVPVADVRRDLRALTHLGGHRPVVRPAYDWESVKIGAGPPPLRVGEGWLGGARLFGFSAGRVHEQRDPLRALLGRRGGTVVYDRIRQVLTDLVREDLERRAGADAAVPVDLAVDSVVGAYLALLSRWVDDDERRPPRDMDIAFRRLVIPGVGASLRLTPAAADLAGTDHQPPSWPDPHG